MGVEKGYRYTHIDAFSIQDYGGNEVRVLYSEGCHLYKDRASVLDQENDRASEVRGVCRASDVIIAVMGLDASNPQLKRIVKIALKAGEIKKTEVSLLREAFMLYDEKGELVLYPGTYHIYIGGSQPDERSMELTKKAVSHFQIILS